MKKTKKRGFTLIELLISMVFISFVIVMSSALFDRAIHSDRQIRQAVVKNTEEFSNMDNFLSEAKDYVTFYKLKGSGESYAKKNNLENENSDIDVLVKMEFKKGMYQNFCNLQKELEEIFHKKVDLIEKSVFDYKFKTKNVREYKEKIREEILESVIYV